MPGIGDLRATRGKSRGKPAGEGRRSKFLIHGMGRSIDIPSSKVISSEMVRTGAGFLVRDKTSGRIWAIDAKGPIRQAFLARSLGAIARMADTDEATINRALEAATDVGTLAYLLSVAAAAPAVAELDPEAELLAEGALLKAELLERAGGTLGVGQVADILRISRQAVDKRRKAGKLIAVSFGADFAYPACQFTADGILTGIDRALEAMAVSDAWMRLEWLLTEDEALGGLSPLEALKAGSVEAVIDLAAGQGGD
jgi:hypothetical protein